jgi:undecaprenyl pyrophosphate phosphatase UppP
LYHLTYLQAIVTGLIQGVTELFPVSSLGHNVLIPALLGGSWAKTLSVSNPDSPYLAFVVGLHVATAIAMIAFFWRDWLRIVGGFLSSIKTRSVSTPDQRLAWMIILATIPVGIVGAVLQKEFTKVFAKPELAAVFLAINGIILLVSERMRRAREAAGATDGHQHAGRHAGPQPALDLPGGRGGPGGAGGPGMMPPRGYSQQPQQQQWQGGDPRSGQDDDWRQYGPNGDGQNRDGQNRDSQYRGGQHERDARGGQAPGNGQGQYGQDQYGRGQSGQQDPWGQQAGADRDPWGGQDPRGGRDRWEEQPTRGGNVPWDGRQDQWDGQGRPARHAAPVGAGIPAGGAGGGAATAVDSGVAADQRLSTMGYKRALIVGAAQVLALLPGISRDGIVTVTGMWRGLNRQDAVRFSFLLSAPVILAAGALKAHDLTGPLSKGMHGPILVGSLISGVAAYLSIRFLTRYFSEDKSLNPFGIYCLIAGIGSLAYLALK